MNKLLVVCATCSRRARRASCLRASGVSQRQRGTYPDHAMKIWLILIALAGLAGCHTAIDRWYLLRDTPEAKSSEAAGCDELRIGGRDGTIYGQVLRPAAFHGERRPVVVFVHGFEAFARFDDLAYALCRAGCVVVMPYARGFLGNGGKYTVDGSVRDIASVVDHVRGKDFRTRYGADGRAVFLLGHSIGCSAVMAAARERRSAVRGLMLLAPYDIASAFRGMTPDAAKGFLKGIGAEALRSDGLDAIYRDIMSGAERLSFASMSVPLKGMNVFLATGEYDCLSKPGPVEQFWSAPAFEDAVRTRADYVSNESLMDVRCALASDVADFILDVTADDRGLKFMTDDEIMLELYARMREGEAGENLSLAAVLDSEGEEISREGDSVNDSVSSHAHAAMKAIQTAEDVLEKHDLTNDRLALYTTVEPCAMCAGGIVQAGIRRVVYGVSAAKYAKATGKAVDTNPNWRKALEQHGIEVTGPVEEPKGEETLLQLREKSR